MKDSRPETSPAVSPPGASDCSGSQYFARPLKTMVLIPASRSLPPMASTARVTRLCSRVVAQETRRTALASAATACLMTFLPGGSASLGEQRRVYNYSGFFGAWVPPAAAPGGEMLSPTRPNSERL